MVLFSGKDDKNSAWQGQLLSRNADRFFPRSQTAEEESPGCDPNEKLWVGGVALWVSMIAAHE